ncbi:MAG: biopolymer transporter ExbD [Bdellovibrionales bacterium]|nr:biopolymer transporter ExbD [Bdellovibrionales bacterium]
MASNRSIRKRRGKEKAEAFSLDITALLDIFTLMMVFLLSSYNSSGVVLLVPNAIDLPISKTPTLSSTGINIQVSKSQIWVEDKEVVNTNTTETSQLFDEGGKRIIPLYDQLIKIKERIKLTEKTSHEAAPFSGVANLIVDKTLKYTYLKRVMYTCAAAGFKEFKFIVAKKAD